MGLPLHPGVCIPLLPGASRLVSPTIYSQFNVKEKQWGHILSQDPVTDRVIQSQINQTLDRAIKDIECRPCPPGEIGPLFIP